MKGKTSRSTEDFVRVIRTMELAQGYVRSIYVAAALKVSRASVNKALARLIRDGYVLHEHYTAIVMTDRGRKLGDELIARYELARKILRSVNPDSCIDEEACSMEHAVSGETLRRLGQRLLIC